MMSALSRYKEVSFNIIIEGLRTTRIHGFGGKVLRFSVRNYDAPYGL